MIGWVQRLLLRLMPRDYRARFGDEIRQDWDTLRRTTREDHGRLAEWRYIARELGTGFRLVLETRRSSRVYSGRSGAWRVDARAALRRVRQRPLHVTAAALMLTAAFSVTLVAFAVANAVMWRDLPYTDPDRLVAVWERTGPDGSREGARVTGSRYVDWRTRATAFDGLAAFGAAGYQVEDVEGVTTVRGVRAAGHLFQMLGISPAVGRLLQPADQMPGAARVVVLSHEYWRTRFGARADIVGHSLRLSGEPHTVVGVLPDVWLPAWPVNPASIQLDPAHRRLWVPLPPDETLARNQSAHVLGVIARLAPGQTVESARHQLESLAATNQPDPHGGVVTPLRAQMVDQTRGPLWILLAAAGCVLIVAGLNLAAIDLASFEGRAEEFRVRAALGASVTALTRQVFLEAAPIVLLASALAAGSTQVVLTSVDGRLGSRIPLLTAPALDATSFIVLAGLACVVIIVMTAWPVLRVRALSRLRDQNAARVTMINPRAFRGLLIGQLTGAVALVMTSTALVQAFLGIGARDPGFDPVDVHIVELSLPRDRYRTPADIAAFERQLQERADTMPGVRASAVSHDHPFEANWSTVVSVPGAVDAADRDVRSHVQLRIVGPAYVQTMGARLVAGRDLSALAEPGDDGEVLINEAYASRAGVALGQALNVSGPRATWVGAVPATYTVVGILQDERFRGLEADVEPAVYISTRQFPQVDLTLLLRMAPGRRPAAGDVRSLLRGIDGGVSAGSIRSLEVVEAELRMPRTLTTMMISGFASGALLLAATGLYGMLSLMVGVRHRDIGIRLALGASPQRIRSQVFLDALPPVMIGLACGLVLAVFAGAGLSTLLTGVKVWAPDTVAVVVLVITGVAVIAAIGPARRAGRTDPTVMLR